MTEKSTKPIATAASKKSASLIAYNVRDAGEKSYWDRIGAAFAHKSGRGFDVVLDSLPLSGRITLVVPSEKVPEDVPPENKAA
jgi:hypothetical protein